MKTGLKLLSSPMVRWIRSRFGRGDTAAARDVRTQSLISKVIWDWPRDEPFRVERAIEKYPELADDPRAIIEFAVEEFADRREGGEAVSATTFARHFPGVQSQLLDSLVVDQGFRDNSDWIQDILSRKPDQYDWPAIGETVSGYRLLEPLGAGGFSRVYLADDPKVPDRKVALKLCRNETHEAVNLANLNHRSIGVVYDVTRDDQRRLGVISMQFRSRTTIYNVVTRLWGGSGRPHSAATVWDEVAKANRLSGEAPEWSQSSFTDWVLDLAIELARGLDESHKNGIIHCDLKPANVLIDREGRPILVDFNVAFRNDAAASPGNVGGTLPYMAPEQIRAFAGSGYSELGPMTDLYGLGATLYELLTGRLPFGAVQSADDGIRTLLSVRKVRPRSMRRFNPDVDSEMERLLLGCMSYEPSARPQTAGELADALERIRTRRMVDSAESGRRRGTRWGFAAAVVALGVVLGLGLFNERPGSVAGIQESHEETLTDGFALLDEGQWENAAERFALVLETDPRNRAAVIGLYRAKAQLQTSKGGAEKINGLVNGKMTPELASFTGYLGVLNFKNDASIADLRYARESGLANEAVLTNLAFALYRSGGKKSLQESAAILDEIRQRFGDREKANLMLVHVIQNRDCLKGGISIAEAEKLINACPPTGLRYLVSSIVYQGAGVKVKKANPELSREYFAHSVEMLKEACRRGEDLRYWNVMRSLLPEDMQAAHAGFFQAAGNERPMLDGREYTIDPLTGYTLKEVQEAAADHVLKPVTVAGNQPRPKPANTVTTKP